MPPMLRRLIGSILLALALAGGQHVTVMADNQDRPVYLVCQLRDTSQLFILVENFGGVGKSVQHCLKFWKGEPLGVAR